MVVEQFTQIEGKVSFHISPCGQQYNQRVLRLQIITVAWMLAECGVALAAAWSARSPALLAFGSDSLVELLSATVVIMQFSPRIRLSDKRADRWAGALLFVLAGVVASASVTALVGRVAPETSFVGIAITVAALVAMPWLSRAKRSLAQELRNSALAADAVQSATCAYLAGITLFGVAFNAVLHVRWIDPVAALVAVPIICIEGRRALRGEACGCC